ncbi:unnamed protein product [Peronospora farinosa]|uniref:Uncharacterized protein n=1 Tax=Peronospora farinosa TaxID=134698 RepID=A0AAV0U200_9STRA|nr:unnamed protein product [Peronospora farinosa]
MLFLPLKEDSLLFRLCLYYGVLVLLLELLIPLLFQRRVRIEIPRLALNVPAVPLSTREFQQRRLALQQQVTELQRALAETPRRSPQKRRQLSSVTTMKNMTAASPSPSLASPAKITRLRSLRKTSSGKTEKKVSRPPFAADSSVHTSKPSPTTMGDFLATRTVRRGGFSFHEVFEEKEDSEEKDENVQQERDNWMQTVTMKTARRRESPTFSRRKKPVRFVFEDADGDGYMGVLLEPSEAATRLEALIEARRRQRTSTSQMHILPPPPSIRIPLSAAIAPAKKVSEHSPLNEPNLTVHGVSPRPQDEGKAIEGDEERKEPKQSEVSSPERQQVGPDTLEEVERRKEPEQSEPLPDFQAFCASFAAGGSAAAQRAVAKRKYHEAFGAVDKEVNDSATTLHQCLDRVKHPRTLRQDTKQSSGDHSADKRTCPESFGSDDKQAINNTVVTQILEKRKHDQAFGPAKKQSQPEEKYGIMFLSAWAALGLPTPRIARQISFDDEVNALADTPLTKMMGRLSNRKRKRTQPFGMIDEDDEDTEWRDSLAFRPHHSRLAE